MKKLAAFVILLSALTTTAQAACAALPTGSISALRLGGTTGDTGVFGPGSTNHPAGTLAWDSTQSKPVYCDGSAWLVLASGGSGGSLNVYLPSGTLLGRYLSIETTAIHYADPATNIPKTIDRESKSAGLVYFSGGSCSGSTYISANTTSGWGCTGAANCTTDAVTASGTSTNQGAVFSSRDYSGNCSGTYQANFTGFATRRSCMSPAGVADRCEIR